MKINYVTCPSCGIVIDFNKCAKLYGENMEWSRSSNEVRVTMCPLCKKEVPEDEEYSGYTREFRLKKDEW